MSSDTLAVEKRIPLSRKIIRKFPSTTADFSCPFPSSGKSVTSCAEAESERDQASVSLNFPFIEEYQEYVSAERKRKREQRAVISRNARISKERNSNKMRCSQGVAMVFEDAFVVFSRFLSLKSRGCALLETHRQRETTGIKKLYNSFFVMF